MPNDVYLQINKIPISPLSGFVKFSNNHIKAAVADSMSSSMEAARSKPKVAKALTNRI